MVTHLALHHDILTMVSVSGSVELGLFYGTHSLFLPLFVCLFVWIVFVVWCFENRKDQAIVGRYTVGT